MLDRFTSLRLRAAQVLTTALVLGSAATLHAAAFGNGSFESPSTGTNYEISSTDAWTLNNAHVTSSSVLNGAFSGNTTAANGSQFATLNKDGAVGSVSQTFDTIANQQYTVSFSQNQFYDGTGANTPQPTSAKVTVTAPGFSQDFTYNRGTVNNTFATDPTWTGHTFTFTATGASSTLTFASDTASMFDFGQAIDNVAVSTPEPASLSLLGLGIAGMMLRRRSC